MSRPAIPLLVLAALSFGSFAQPGAPPTAGYPRALTVEGLEAGAAPTVLIQGEECTVLGVAPAQGTALVLYFDFTLSTPRALAGAVQLLSTRAETLVALGPVRIVVAGDLVELLLETTDAAELRTALGEVAAAAPEAGGFAALRDELYQTIQPGEDSSWLAGAAELLAEERALVRWQLERMTAALLDLPGGEERVALLVQGSYDLAPLRALERRHGPLPRAFAERERDGDGGEVRTLARALVAAGYTLAPFGADAERGDIANGEPLALWIEASDSPAVDDPGVLDRFLERLASRYLVRYRCATARDEPAPLDLRGVPRGATHRRFAATFAPRALGALRARLALEADPDDERDDDAQDTDDGFGESQTPGAEHRTMRLNAALLVPDDEAPAASLELMARGGSAPPAAAATAPRVLRTTVMLAGFDQEAIQFQHTTKVSTAPGSPFFLVAQVPLPRDLDRGAVVVEDLVTGEWGVTLLEPEESGLGIAAADRPEQVDWTRPPQTATSAPATAAASTPATASPAATAAREGGGPVLMLVPPRGRDLTGRVEIKTITASTAIGSVVFHHDGREVTTDGNPPFSVRLDLGAELRPHLIEAFAKTRDGSPLGRAALTLNRPATRTGITLVRVAAQPDGALLVEAALQLEPGQNLDRVELWRNTERLLTLTEGPWQARLPGGPGGSGDWVRAVAVLRDGTSLEDVRLLGGEGATERVVVNLVQVFAVVTDAKGTPVAGLTERDFTLLRDKQPLEIERFAVADEVPLALGLVVDTSMSMLAILDETRRAVAIFLGNTLRHGDRGFLVDFDDRPRLLQGLTAERGRLLTRLGQLQEGGFTALYDAIVFGLLQFDERQDRRALVLLSDGDDYRSKLGFSRVIDSARSAAVPIYVLALGGLDPDRPSFRKDDLEAIAGVSGGRVFYVDELAQVLAAYDTISQELRSQYVLGFSTDRPLDPRELRAVSVRASAGHLVRVSVGQRGG